jgi:hypothetical protein
MQFQVLSPTAPLKSATFFFSSIFWILIYYIFWIFFFNLKFSRFFFFLLRKFSFYSTFQWSHSRCGIFVHGDIAVFFRYQCCGRWILLSRLSFLGWALSPIWPIPDIDSRNFGLGLYRIFFDPKIQVILITFLYLELFFSRPHRFLCVFEMTKISSSLFR